MGSVLYSFRRCPYAMRARMALKISGLDYEHREVLLRNKPQAMLDASPKGTVPVFVLSNGQIIDESLDLMRFALEKNDPKSWLDCDLNEADGLIAENDGPFKHHLDRYKYASRYDKNAKRGDTDKSERHSAEQTVAKYENRLQNSSFLLGSAQSIADIAIFPFLRQFANADKDWWDNAPYPAVRKWLDRHVTGELFKSIMTKYPLWEAEQKLTKPFS